MKNHSARKLMPWLAVMLALLAAFGCSPKSGDEVISVADDDAKMNAAIAKARETLPHFWQTFGDPTNGETEFALKVKIEDKNGSEHFWTIDLEKRDTVIKGTINNDPNIVKNVKLGDRLDIPEADISDWTYMKNGKMYGNHTLKVLLEHMSKEEAAVYRKLMAE